MDRLKLMFRVRSLTRDLSNAIFREVDVIDYINEAIERVQQVIPEMEGMTPLLDNTQVPTHLPRIYHHLLAVYGAARLFSQDEQHYQASTLMNEFEIKLEELKSAIASGDIIIVDPETGEPVESEASNSYVVNNYFYSNRGRISEVD